MNVRRLTESGRQIYSEWLAQRKPGDQPPQDLVDGVGTTEVLLNLEIDLTEVFASRFEFGRFMVELLANEDARTLLNQKNDGLWDWLTIAYFAQFGRKASKPWHYTVTRRGHSGSLAYRHLARTAFEMYWRHGADSLLMLHVDMSTWGELSEQLTSRQNIAYHRGYIRAARALYLAGGRLKRGAASRVRPAAKRRLGETSGRGAAARLALAVRRLCRTYDTHVLDTPAMLALLPREFNSFITQV